MADHETPPKRAAERRQAATIGRMPQQKKGVGQQHRRRKSPAHGEPHAGHGEKKTEERRRGQQEQATLDPLRREPVGRAVEQVAEDGGVDLYSGERIPFPAHGVITASSIPGAVTPMRTMRSRKKEAGQRSSRTSARDTVGKTPAAP